MALQSSFENPGELRIYRHVTCTSVIDNVKTSAYYCAFYSVSGMYGHSCGRLDKAGRDTWR